jgi:hypothetical protein
MEKRGINPLIASVFLIGLAFIIGLIVFASMGSVTRNTLSKQEEAVLSTEPINFEVSLKENCGDNCYTLLISNKEEKEIGFLVRTIGDKGVDVYGGGVILSPYQARLFDITFDLNKVGNKIETEVVPFTYG